MLGFMHIKVYLKSMNQKNEDWSISYTARNLIIKDFDQYDKYLWTSVFKIYTFLQSYAVIFIHTQKYNQIYLTFSGQKFSRYSYIKSGQIKKQ